MARSKPSTGIDVGTAEVFHGCQDRCFVFEAGQLQSCFYGLDAVLHCVQSDDCCGPCSARAGVHNLTGHFLSLEALHQAVEDFPESFRSTMVHPTGRGMHISCLAAVYQALGCHPVVLSTAQHLLRNGVQLPRFVAERQDVAQLLKHHSVVHALVTIGASFHLITVVLSDNHVLLLDPLKGQPTVQPGKGVEGFADAVLQLMQQDQTVIMMAAVTGAEVGCPPIDIGKQLQQHFNGFSCEALGNLVLCLPTVQQFLWSCKLPQPICCSPPHLVSGSNSGSSSGTGGGSSSSCSIGSHVSSSGSGNSGGSSKGGESTISLLRNGRIELSNSSSSSGCSTCCDMPFCLHSSCCCSSSSTSCGCDRLCDLSGTRSSIRLDTWCGRPTNLPSSSSSSSSTAGYQNSGCSTPCLPSGSNSHATNVHSFYPSCLNQQLLILCSKLQSRIEADNSIDGDGGGGGSTSSSSSSSEFPQCRASVTQFPAAVSGVASRKGDAKQRNRIKGSSCYKAVGWEKWRSCWEEDPRVKEGIHHRSSSSNMISSSNNNNHNCSISSSKYSACYTSNRSSARWQNSSNCSRDDASKDSRGINTSFNSCSDNGACLYTGGRSSISTKVLTKHSSSSSENWCDLKNIISRGTITATYLNKISNGDGCRIGALVSDCDDAESNSSGAGLNNSTGTNGCAAVVAAVAAGTNRLLLHGLQHNVSGLAGYAVLAAKAAVQGVASPNTSLNSRLESMGASAAGTDTSVSVAAAAAADAVADADAEVGSNTGAPVAEPPSSSSDANDDANDGEPGSSPAADAVDGSCMPGSNRSQESHDSFASKILQARQRNVVWRGDGRRSRPSSALPGMRPARFPGRPQQPWPEQVLLGSVLNGISDALPQANDGTFQQQLQAGMPQGTELNMQQLQPQPVQHPKQREPPLLQGVLHVSDLVCKGPGTDAAATANAASSRQPTVAIGGLSDTADVEKAAEFDKMMSDLEKRPEASELAYHINLMRRRKQLLMQQDLTDPGMIRSALAQEQLSELTAGLRTALTEVFRAAEPGGRADQPPQGEPYVKKGTNAHILQRVQAAEAEAAAARQEAAAARQEAAAPKQQAVVAQQESAALRMNRCSQTTQNEVAIGKVFAAEAGVLDAAVALPALSQDQLNSVTSSVASLLQAWRATWPDVKTLEDAVKAKAGTSNPNEKKHMQPLVMELIEVLGDAVGTKLSIADTHQEGPIDGQGGAIDCSLLWRKGVHHWSYLVCALEFKLKDMLAALGQLITRCRCMFDAQSERTFAFAVGLTCNQLQLYRVQSNPTTGALYVEKTIPLSLEDAQQQMSAEAQGITLLAQVLAAGSNVHGFKPPVVPVDQVVAGRLLCGFQLVRPGSSKVPGATVYKAKWRQVPQQQPPIDSQASSIQGVNTAGIGSEESFGGDTMEVDGSDDEQQASVDDDCIVKVGVTDKEVKLLQQVGHQPHCVRLMAACTLHGNQQQCVILQPCVHVFSTAPDLKTLAKLGSDVASAIAELFEDFGDSPGQRQSATGHPRKFTGTPLYAALCVLDYKPHSVSSDLEALYYSLRHISYGTLPDEGIFQHSSSVTDWALARRGAYTQKQDFGSNEFAEMISSLHKLFWLQPQSGGVEYWYEKGVPVEVSDFKQVCDRFL